jgi:hypothetical protein
VAGLIALNPGGRMMNGFQTERRMGRGDTVLGCSADRWRRWLRALPVMRGLRPGELVQANDRHQGVGREHEDGQVGDERDQHRGLEGEHCCQREQNTDAERGLAAGERQGAEGEPALPSSCF